MLRYILKRLIQMVPLLLIISFIAFGIIRVAEIYGGADPLAQVKMDPSTTQEKINQEKQRLGYEKAYEETVTPTGKTYQITKTTATNISEDSLMVTYTKADGEIQAGDKLEYIRPYDMSRASQVGVTLEDLKIPASDVKLEAGQFTFENNQFYFHKDDLNKELKLAYGTPNGFVVRYYIWAKQFIQGDMGESYTYKAPVSEILLSRIGNTVLLGISSITLTWLVAIPLGIFLAVRQYSLVDQVFSSISYFFMGFPDFFLALIFLLLAASTGWFPIGGKTSIEALQSGSLITQIIDTAHHLVLPTLTLSLISIASLQRRMRANLLDILGEEYIKTARAKGLSENKVIYKHAVRNAINPIITLLGFEVASLVSGAAFVEIIFSWPGLGNTMLQALLGTDLNLVMAGLVISAFMLLLGNLLADLLLAAVDPRIKLEA